MNKVWAVPSEVQAARLSFVCPEDYSLGELSSLLEDITILYDKLELVAEGEGPFDIYDGKRRWNRGTKPDVPLVLRKVHYGSDLGILVVGATAINDVLTILSLGSKVMELPQWWERRHVRGEFEKMLLNSLDSKLRKNAEQLAEKYDLSLERLLEYVGPQLRAIYQNRAKRKRRKRQRAD